MASRAILLLTLFLVTALIEASPHRKRSHDRSHESIDLDFYKEHPELVFRACGKPLLRLAIKIKTEICEESDSIRDAPVKNISECCSEGCTYESMFSFLCN